MSVEVILLSGNTKVFEDVTGGTQNRYAVSEHGVLSIFDVAGPEPSKAHTIFSPAGWARVTGDDITVPGGR